VSYRNRLSDYRPQDSPAVSPKLNRFSKVGGIEDTKPFHGRFRENQVQERLSCSLIMTCRRTLKNDWKFGRDASRNPKKARHGNHD
jgi:hypothetical protein